VTKGEFIDMFKAGIVDPTKVTRSALEKRCFCIKYAFNNKVVVTDIPEEKKSWNATSANDATILNNKIIKQ